MSQRRQDARRAQQERQRESERRRRQEQRRHATAVADRPTATSPPPSRRLLTARNIWIGAGVVVALLLIAGGIWAWSTTREHLPGEKFPTAGNSHLASIDEPHENEPYTSNPPTSGPHLGAIPKPGVYKTPKRAEELGHFMEHGGVWVLYNCPDGCESDVAELERIVNRAIDRGDPTAIAPYPTMEHKFALTAWQYLLTLDELDTKQVNNFIERLACNYAPEGPDSFCPVKRGSVASNSQNRSMAPASATPFSVFGNQTPAPSAAPSSSP